MREKRDNKKAIYAALVGNCLIACFKLVAAIFTKSSTMLAEAYHSFSDTGNQILLLIGINQSQKKSDRTHPFGYGKEQYFYAFMVAMLLFGVAGVLSVQEGVRKLFNPEPISHLPLIFAVLAFAFVVELYAFLIAYKELKKEMREEKFKGVYDAIKNSKDPAVLTVIFEDSLALTSIIIAAISIGLTYYLKNPIFDAVGSIIIGALLMIFAVALANETKKLLVGEAVSDSKREKIVEAIMSNQEVNEIVDLRTMHLGPEEVMVTAEINIQDGLKTDDAEKVIDNIEAKIKEVLPKSRLYIELEGPSTSYKKFGGIKRTFEKKPTIIDPAEKVKPAEQMPTAPPEAEKQSEGEK